MHKGGARERYRRADRMRSLKSAQSFALVERLSGVTVVAVTGASGSVGQAVIPELAAHGFEMRLFGRNPQRLKSLYPKLAAYSNAEIEAQLAGCDAVLHLATINNDASATEDQARAINVEWPRRLATRAREQGVSRLVLMSSTHALDVGNKSAYAVTKRKLAIAVHEIHGLNVTEIVAPKIYDHRRKLNATIWKFLGGLKPTISTADLTPILIEELEDRHAGSRVRLVSSASPRPAYYTAFSALLDILVAIGVLVAFGWLLLGIAIAIRLDSQGPALFRQVRVGKNRSPFTCWKFRTMQVGTVHRATHETSASSVTRVGAFLRRTKLDELPQIMNLIRRELSLVGPRPCLPNQLELIEERAARGVFTVKPGITGYAQVNDVDMSDPAKLAAWDERYCALRSVLFDLRILIGTFLGKGRGDRVSSI